MQNYKLIIEYDGTDYHGWQIQAKDVTIQAVIQNALSLMTKEPIILHGSGRTDAGVHALGQTASFKTGAKIPAAAYVSGLNSLLPDDIVIRSCEPVDETFHARFSARRKTYRYHIVNRPIPTAIGRRFAWHIRKRLDLDAMRRAAAGILGEHDFKSFEGTGSPRAHTVRTVLKVDFYELPDFFEKNNNVLVFEITADGFLRYMVRNLVGTLADVGLSKTSVDEFKRILESKNRDAAGATAPPHGLFLVNVFYD
ncbi:MAG: tRNA pseudouridine(38-40) synthase TruA [Desulfosalsimonadaceae bacterium]